MIKYALFEYIPKRYAEKASFWQQDLNRRILDFKDGRLYATRWAAKLIAYSLSCLDLTDTVLVGIPAHCPYSHARRYKRFLQLLSSQCNAINGYDHITVKRSREKVHVSRQYDWCTRHTEYIDVDSDFFQGKKVIVFDDICTSCTTANTFISHLQNAGADVCMAVFLAKTKLFKQ